MFRNESESCAFAALRRYSARAEQTRQLRRRGLAVSLASMKDPQDTDHFLPGRKPDPVVARPEPEFSTTLQTLDVPSPGRKEAIHRSNDALCYRAVQTSQVSKRLAAPFNGFHLRPNSSRT